MLKRFFLWGMISISSTMLYATKITLHITNQQKSIPTLYLPGGEALPISLNNQGKGSIEFNPTKAGYIKIGYNYVTRLFWVDPNSNLNLSFNGAAFYKALDVQGDHLPINHYLNQTQFQFAQINDTELNEVDFLQKSDSLLKVNLQKLEQSNLPASFKVIERKRLVYLSYQTLPSYPEFHKRISKDKGYKPSQTYWNKLKELAVFKGELLGMEDYQSFIGEAVRELSNHEFHQLKGIDRLTAYVAKHVHDSQIAEMLVFRRVYAHVQNKGLDDSKYATAFHKYVKSPKLIKKFNQLCAQYNSLDKGSPSADFNATNLEGKKVSLKELRGKYVYIDIWATWCVPCRKELPLLKELEEKYQNAPIHFVSISCDTNRKAWEKMVTAKKMKGIQLHFTDDSFMKKYLIKGIPHFILLDKEGKIISADMTRPSDPATAALIDQLVK